jgi:hypothetical protein
MQLWTLLHNSSHSIKEPNYWSLFSDAMHQEQSNTIVID